MARKVNWSNEEAGMKALERRIKNLQAAAEYLADKPEPGYFKDNISKKMVEISECKSSSLRRYLKIVDNYYYLVTSSKDKEFLLDKKKEIEDELNHRDDATVKK